MAASEGKALALAAARGEIGGLIAAFGPHLAGGLTLYCLDAANVFDPLPLAAWLRAHRLDVRRTLERRLFVSRAFTCHQLAAAADRLLPPLLEAPAPTAALILGIEAMFLDEDLRLAERRRLFAGTLHRAGDLRRRGLPLLIASTCPDPDNPWRRRLAAQTAMLADVGRALPALKGIGHGTHAAHLQRSA